MCHAGDAVPLPPPQPPVSPHSYMGIGAFAEQEGGEEVPVAFIIAEVRTLGQTKVRPGAAGQWARAPTWGQACTTPRGRCHQQSAC